jgi:hypothetical protein
MIAHTSHSPAGPDDRDPPGDGAAESADAPFNALCWPYVHLRGGIAGRPTGPANGFELDRPQRLGRQRSCSNGRLHLAYRQRKCGDVACGFRPLARALGQP